MTILKKVPGPILIFLGAVALSFGGVIVKSFEGANLWQILFWRQFFFSIIVTLYLLLVYRKNFLNLYNVDIHDPSNFDLLLDTTNLSSKEVFGKVSTFIDIRISGI